MEEKLHRIRIWANRGTLGQFYNEMSAKLAGSEYQVDMKGNHIRFYQVAKSGGFLGIGVKRTRELVLEVIRDGEELRIPAATAKPDFIEFLRPMLTAH